jgi:hypothetical protein
MNEDYWDWYYRELNKKVDKLRAYYDIDKVKRYSVYVWNKADTLEEQDNIFDIQANEIIFYTDDHTIIEEAKPIIEDIQWFISQYNRSDEE